MKIRFILFLAVFCLSGFCAEAVLRTVSNPSDSLWAPEDGSLRLVLQAACDQAGDDDIWFNETTHSTISVQLAAELVIPADCKGQVTLHGSPSADTILNASRLSGEGVEAGDACIINVYSDNNTISNFSLVNHEKGAGVCFFGRSNRLENSRLGTTVSGQQKPNRYGVVVSDSFATEGDVEEMDGSGSVIFGNAIEFNFSHGVFLKANEVTVQKNTILANGGCPDEDQFPSQSLGCVQSDQEEGFGIFVKEDKRDVLIGGDVFEEDANTIRYNKSGGVAVEGDSSLPAYLNRIDFSHLTAIRRPIGTLDFHPFDLSDMVASGVGLGHSLVFITHNIISNNYGTGEGIDLAADGFSENDTGDRDSGPNNMLNYIDHFQSFKLVSSSDGSDRFWSWGIEASGSRIELYQASEEDVEQSYYHGGGESYIADLDIEDMTFSLSPEDALFVEGDLVTGLNFTESGATSEFAYSAFVGEDADYDGIIDTVEEGDASESNAALADTDGDFLSDAFEDKNHNGLCDTDAGETCANAADTDNDGLSDYVETHGDGIYDAGVDTDPLDRDTDNDGVLDGNEDKNDNGIYEPYLGETNPLSSDSDGDGVSDGTDNCPSVYNPGQEANYCQS